MIVSPEWYNGMNGSAAACRPAEAVLANSRQIRDELERILSSRTFRRSDRLRRFISFIVERSLEHAGDMLKEYVIGTEVYGRPESFDARKDPIVRVEARRLRARLNEYYSGEGRSDPIEFRLPKGAYVPTIHERPGPEAGLEHFRSAQMERRIAVERFVALSARARVTALARALTVELLHALHAANLRVHECQPAFSGSEQLNPYQCVYAVLRGTVQQQRPAFRILLRLTRAADQMLLWSEMYTCSDADADTQECLARSAARHVAEHLEELPSVAVIDRVQTGTSRANA